MSKLYQNENSQAIQDEINEARRKAGRDPISVYFVRRHKEKQNNEI